MKEYFALTNRSDIISLGFYESFSEAFYDNEDKPGIQIVWILSETGLERLRTKIDLCLFKS